MDSGLKSCYTGMEKVVLQSTHFLRGLIRSDRATVPTMVANELSHLPGWCDTDPVCISMKANHGYGGGKTFRVSAPIEVCASPPEVAVHICQSEHEPWASATSRVADASEVFAAAGLSPACLAQGSNYYIQAWEGHGRPSLKSREEFEDQGRILAKIHSLPTQWFDKHRNQLISQFPALGRAPLGSHAWAHIHPARVHQFSCVGFGGIAEEVLQAFVEAPLTAPQNPIAARIVTCHIDLHTGNLLRTDQGLMCIDFESACVTYAACDLALAMGLANYCAKESSLSALEIKQAVARSYLEQMGESCDSNDIEDLILEAELARACYLHSELTPNSLRGSPKTAIELIDAVQSFTSRVRSSSSLRAAMIELGYRHCASEDASLSLAWKTHTESMQRLIDRALKGLPSPSVSTDAGASIDNDDASEDSFSVWGLPLGINEMRLPLCFDDAGLAKDLTHPTEHST